jgi:hypothetical protein
VTEGAPVFVTPPRSLSDFHTNRRIRSPIDQFRLSYAKCSDLDATEKPKLRVAEQIKRKSDRLLGATASPPSFPNRKAPGGPAAEPPPLPRRRMEPATWR